MMIRLQSARGMIATWRRCGVTGTRMLLSGCVLAIFLGGVTPLEAAAQTQGSPAVSFPDEPAVHAQYDKLVQILQQAESFSYDSTYRWGARGEEIGHATYQLWMKKPGLARLEAYRDGRLTGTLVGDGEQFWIFWPDKRPMMSLESEAEYATSSTKVYMREARPANLYSIAHQTSKLGSMGMLIMQPSIVHGNMGSLEEYLDAVRGRGTEEVGGETCEVIELSYMKGQRSKYYWLA